MFYFFEYASFILKSIGNEEKTFYDIVTWMAMELDNVLSYSVRQRMVLRSEHGAREPYLKINDRICGQRR